MSEGKVHKGTNAFLYALKCQIVLIWVEPSFFKIRENPQWTGKDARHVEVYHSDDLK